jgi:hypothetical protein
MSLTIKEVIRGRQLAIDTCNLLRADVIPDVYAHYRELGEKGDEYADFVARSIASIWVDFVDLPDMNYELGL